MNEVVELFGTELSKILGKSVLASKGFIRLALKDDGKEPKLKNNTLNFEDMKYVIDHGLKTRLLNLNLDNPNQVISKLQQILIDHQAIFVMNS